MKNLFLSLSISILPAILFSQVLEQDSLALVDLYNSTNGVNWKNNDNWLTGPVSTWYNIGVTDGRVTDIELGSNNLVGTIPASLGNLSNLQYLNLLANQLSGSIPIELGNLSNLQILSLSGNQLIGSIPSELGNLSNLWLLYLIANQLSGSIPSELSNLFSLKYLDISRNQFINLPDLSSITTLIEMRIQNNKFTYEDIEPNIGIAPSFIYSPQDSAGLKQDTTITLGSTLTLSISVGGEHNQYQWKKDGVIIPGANDSSYTIGSATFFDSGTYICEITNTVATALTLYSRPIHVTVEKLEEYDITGQIIYYSNDAQIDSALVKANNFYSDITDLNGDYEFLDLSPDNYVVRPEKENDIGNAISALDAAWILQHGVELRTFIPYQLIAGDVTGNGSVTAYDAARVLQYDVGLINKFPVMPDNTHFWRFVPEDFPITQTNWNTAPDSIAYTPLNSDTTDNYVGIIYGDVSGNWSSTEGGLLARSIAATAEIRLEAGSGRNGDKICIPVYLDNRSGIISMSFSLTYNPQLLKAIGVSLTELTQGFIIAHNVLEGEIKVALAGSQPIKRTGSLVNIDFEVLNNELPEGAGYLTIKNMQINDGSIVVNIQTTMLEIDSALPGEYALHQNYPNPFNAQTVIKYQLPKSAKVTLKIYNTVGQEIRTLVNEEIKAGFHEIHWDGRNDEGSRVSSGIYFYQISTGDFIKVRKMLFVM